MYISIVTKSMSKQRFIKPDKLIISQQTKSEGYPPEPFNQYMYNLKIIKLWWIQSTQRVRNRPKP